MPPVLKKIVKRSLNYYRLFKRPIWAFSIVVGLAFAWKFVPVIYFATFTPPAVAVSAESAKSENWHEELRAIGTLVAVQAVTVSPEVGGRVTKISFEPGQRIKEGEPILQLNDESEVADLQRNKATLDFADLALSRSQQLAQKNVESKADRDQKESKKLESLANVNQAQALINKKNIRAPFDGILGIRQVDLGQYLQPGTPIVTLTNATKLFINFSIAERYRTQLSTDQKIVFVVDAFGDKKFEGKITTIDPQVNEETRTVQVQATINNEDLKLSPGMFADIRVILPEEKGIISVPETAIDFGLYGDAVYVIEESGEGKKKTMKAIRKFVKTGMHKDGRVAITEGVEADQKVITAGQLKLNTGAAVRLSEEPELQPKDPLPKP